MVRIFSGLLGLGLMLACCLTGSGQQGSWSTVKGQITFDSKADLPKQMPLNLQGNADKAYCEKNGPVLSESWVIDQETRGIKNVFVWLANEDIKNKKLPIHPSLTAAPSQPVEMDQPVCQFIPHSLALREGQDLWVKNNAKIPHNFKYTGNPLSENAGGNFLMPPGTDKKVKLVADRLPIQVECNIHPWMRGWVRVFDHPYFAVTDDKGRFELKDAPAGKYRLMVWHSSGWRGGAAGKNGEVIDIKSGGVTDLGKVDFPAPKE